VTAPPDFAGYGRVVAWRRWRLSFGRPKPCVWTTQNIKERDNHLVGHDDDDGRCGLESERRRHQWQFGGGYSPQFSPVEAYGTNLWVEITNLTNNAADFMVSNTIADVEYEVQSTTNLAGSQWIFEGFFYGSEITNWTPTSAMATNYPNLFYRIRSWQSSDGSGIPDWWDLKYFGTTGIDPYADPDGDGWNNLQEFQNGTDPTVFNTPPAPQGVTASLHQVSNTATVSWLPDTGNITSYTVEKTDSNTGTVQYSNVTASATSYLDYISSDTPDFFNGDNYDVSYQVKANYTGGSSAWSASTPLQQPTVSASITPGANGSTDLAISGLPANAVTVRLVFIDSYADFFYNDHSFDYVENIPISSFTNGLFQVPAAWQPVPDAYDDPPDTVYVESIDTNGNASAASLLNSSSWSPLFFDGRMQLKQNLKFLLRAATMDNSFGYYTDSGSGVYSARTFSSSYAEASFYQNYTYFSENEGAYIADNPPFLNVLQPFQDNYLYENCVFNTSLLNGGFLATGILQHGFGPSNDYLIFSNTLAYTFIPPITNGTPIAALGPDQAQWLATGQFIRDPSYLTEIGVNHSTYTNTMLSGVRNIFGLRSSQRKLHGPTAAVPQPSL